LTKQQKKEMKGVEKDDLKKHVLEGQVDLRASGLDKKGITSWYGATNAGEFFAEAFKDVYAHGAKARKASIQLVKNYEKLMKKKKDYGFYSLSMV
ncbi:MAG: hypothetical protein IKN36_03940, partial [Clostridia bacterium]|nr:hypothetical protein [Clostridia bacterium]